MTPIAAQPTFLFWSRLVHTYKLSGAGSKALYVHPFERFAYLRAGEHVKPLKDDVLPLEKVYTP